MFDHRNLSTWLSVEKKVPLVPIIAPSILASDFANLLTECRDVLSVEGGSSEWLHVDVMDGHFVPNISIGSCVVDSLRKHLPNAFLDCHLMVSEPEKWVADFAQAGASQYTFHIEATSEPRELIKLIRQHKMQVGVALKPKTPVDAVTALVEEGLVDMVLVMTVEPGFGGQSFMADMMPKVAALRSQYPWLNVEVDGGLGPKTIGAAAEAGANVIVAGTSVFRAPSRKVAVEQLRDCVQQSLNLL